MKQQGIGWRFGALCLSLILIVGCGGGSDDKKEDSKDQQSSADKKSTPQKLDSQPAPVAPGQQAIGALELDFARLQQSSMGALAGEDQLKEMAGPAREQAEILASLKRIKIYFNAPKNVQTVMAFAQGGPGQAASNGLPLEFRVDVEFKDADKASEVFEQVKAGLQEVTLDGKTMYLPDSAETGEPPVYFEIVNDTQLKMGSKSFMKVADVPLTDTVKSQWSKLPVGDFRLVLDLDSARPLFSELSAMLREEVPLMFSQFVDVIDQASYVALSTDGKSDTLMQLNIEGHNSDEAANIKTVIAGILDLGVKSSQRQLAQIRESDPKAAEMFSNLMSSMAPKINNNNVTVSVTKPEGFDEVMQETVVKAREAAKRAQGVNEFKQISLSVHNYHDTYRCFPWQRKPELADESISWRVVVLPFLEESPLYDRFDIKSPWDSEQNLAAAETMPTLFGQGGNLASIVSIKLDDQPTSFAQITDGMSNTIMLMETTTPVPWTKAGGITIDEAIEILNSLEDDQVLRVCYYDGSVQVISKEIGEDVLRAKLDPRDGK